MLRTLAALRDTLNRINLIGPEDMLREMETMLGQMVENVMIARTDESKSLFKKSADVAESISKIVTAFRDVGPLALLGYAIIEKILG